MLASVVAGIAVKYGGRPELSEAEKIQLMDPSVRFYSVVEYFQEHGVSDVNEMIREGSYQNEAVKWIAYKDPRLRQVPESSPASKEGYVFVQ